MLLRRRITLLFCTLALWSVSVWAETLYYKVFFGVIPVGFSRMVISCDESSGFCELKSYARTTGFVDLFYSVRDRFKSRLPSDLSSFSFYEAKIREGRYRRKDKIVYDANRHLLLYYRNSKLKRKAVVKGRVYDPLSAYYVFSVLVRKGNVKAVESFAYFVTTGKKEVIPEIAFLGQEEVKTGCGVRKALKFSLKVAAKGLLMARDAGKPVQIWLDKDEGYLVKALVPTRWGNIKIILSKLDI